MKRTGQGPGAPECTHQLTMIVDPVIFDRAQFAATRLRLRAAGIRLRLVTRAGTPVEDCAA
ncbi:hypothetical protein [Croceibacterium soli]|uniref:hypothetical protein n=1 Tax=Croceibacterium soli TaxID=1739690 RepID=UPI00136CC471|nr:hypothetical protein [Croceibacterium soli]